MKLILKPNSITLSIFSGITLCFVSSALAGGVSGGGGNLAKQQPVAASEVEHTLNRFKEVLPLVMNQFAMTFVKDGFRGDRDVPAGTTFSFISEKFGTLKTISAISKKSQAAQLTFQRHGCASRNSQGPWIRSQASTQGYFLADGSVVAIQEPMICFDSEAIAPLISKASLVRELGALFGHEVSHQIGFDEGEAQTFQDYLLNSLSQLGYMPTPASDLEYLGTKLEQRILGLEKLRVFAMAGPNAGALSVAVMSQLTSLMDFQNSLTPSHLNGLALLDLPSSRIVLAAAIKLAVLLLATPKDLLPGLEMGTDYSIHDFAQGFDGRPQVGFNQFVENHYRADAVRREMKAWWVPVVYRDDIIIRNVSDQNRANMILEVKEALDLLKEVKRSVDKKAKQLGR